MEPLTTDHLKRFIRALTQKGVSKQWRTSHPEVLAALDRYRRRTGGRGDDWSDLTGFLEDAVRGVVSELWGKADPSAVFGAVLWYETYIGPLRQPTEGRGWLAGSANLPTSRDSSDYWRAVGERGWPIWQRRYGFSPTMANPFNHGRTKAYQSMAAGRELIVQRINTAPSSAAALGGGFPSLCRNALKHRLQQTPDGTFSDLFVPPLLLTQDGTLQTEEALAACRRENHQGQTVLMLSF